MMHDDRLYASLQSVSAHVQGFHSLSPRDEQLMQAKGRVIWPYSGEMPLMQRKARVPASCSPASVSAPQTRWRPYSPEAGGALFDAPEVPLMQHKMGQAPPTDTLRMGEGMPIGRTAINLGDGHGCAPRTPMNHVQGAALPARPAGAACPDDVYIPRRRPGAFKQASTLSGSGLGHVVT